KVLFKKKKDFGSRLKSLFRIGVANEEFYEELEELFLEGDLGPKVCMELVDEIRDLAKSNGLSSEEQLRKAVVEKIASTVKTVDLRPEPDAPSCYLVLGVNGVGK